MEEQKDLGSYSEDGTADAVSVPSTVGHTPGPWYWRDVEDMRTLAPGVLILGDGIGCGGPWGDDIDQQNARLIAAAPDLLDALEDLLMHCGIADAAPEDKDDIDHRYERAARAAIAKALGQ